MTFSQQNIRKYIFASLPPTHSLPTFFVETPLLLKSFHRSFVTLFSSQTGILSILCYIYTYFIHFVQSHQKIHPKKKYKIIYFIIQLLLNCNYIIRKENFLHQYLDAPKLAKQNIAISSITRKQTVATLVESASYLTA